MVPKDLTLDLKTVKKPGMNGAKDIQNDSDFFFRVLLISWHSNFSSSHAGESFMQAIAIRFN